MTREKTTFGQRHTKAPGGAAAALLAVGVLAAACGGSNSAGASSSPTGPAASEIQKASQIVDNLTNIPQKIAVTARITKPIPKGLTIDYMECGVPSCKLSEQPAQAAAKALGWNLRVIPTGSTPEEVHSAWVRVTQDLPAAVISQAYPKVIFQDSLNVLKAHNIPVVAQAEGLDMPGDGILDITVNPEDVAVVGTTLAAKAVADTSAKGHVLFVNNKDIPLVTKIQASFASEMKTLCTNCQTSTYEASISQMGSTLPSLLAAYLRAHPDINYMVFGTDANAVGVPAALSSAGLKVPFIGFTGDPVNLQMVANGQAVATIKYDGWDSMFRLVDQLARHFAGVSDGTEHVQSPFVMFTKQNIDKTELDKFVPLIPNVQAQYEALWRG